MIIEVTDTQPPKLDVEYTQYNVNPHEIIRIPARVCSERAIKIQWTAFESAGEIRVDPIDLYKPWRPSDYF